MLILISQVIPMRIKIGIFHFWRISLTDLTLTILQVKTTFASNIYALGFYDSFHSLRYILPLTVSQVSQYYNLFRDW